MKLGNAVKSMWRRSALGEANGVSLKKFASERPTGQKWRERKRDARRAPRLVSSVRGAAR